METRPRLDELTERVSSGEFHVTTDIRLPCGCIDGRCGGAIRPNAAGGTLTLAVADDLVNQRYLNGAGTAQLLKTVLHSLAAHCYPVGGHTADEIHGNHASGCGATDKLADIYQMIAMQPDTIRQMAALFKMAVHDDDHSVLVDRVSQRRQFSTGQEVLEALRSTAPSDSIDVLHGPHREVLAVINLRSGTTLDRDAVQAQFGSEYEVFNIDAWSFEAGARALNPTADEATIRRMVTAMVYFNIATTLVLCGPSMRMIVLD